MIIRCWHAMCGCNHPNLQFTSLLPSIHTQGRVEYSPVYTNYAKSTFKVPFISVMVDVHTAQCVCVCVCYLHVCVYIS